MFNLAGYSESLAAATVSNKLTALADQAIKAEGDNITVPDQNKLIGVYAIGTDIRNVELSSPSLRRLALYDVAPVENGALPTFPPDPIFSGQNYLDLDPDEFLVAYAGNSNAGAQQESVFVFFGDDKVSQVVGKVFTVKATASYPATAYAWAPAALTLSQELPVGSYKLVGARCECAHAIAFRFVFIGLPQRPGHIAVAGISDRDVPKSRNGELGEWGIFPHNKIPSIEFFGDGTAAAAAFYLDLIKV